MSALFNIDSLLRLIILMICTTTYIKTHFPSLVSKRTKGFASIFYKCSIIGERLSIYVSIMCIIFGMKKLISLVV